MPAIGFICPDKEKIPFEECFKECRMKHDLPCGRCKALPFLRKAARQREWTGEPSTTQLLIGTREAWLKITRPYYINPDDRVFAILGTHAHGILERFGKGDHFTEERLRNEICSGTFDFYDGETMTLFDYKTWGSWKVMQVLGIKKVDVPVVDENERPVLIKSGPNKGSPKTKKVFINGDIALRVAAILETSIQISDYKYKLLEILPNGYTVKSMAIQVISRDSGLLVSTIRGIEEKAPLIPVNGISRHWVKKFLRRKREMLFEAIEKDYSTLCRRRETWDGKKCESYCEVKDECFLQPGWETMMKDIEKEMPMNLQLI